MKTLKIFVLNFISAIYSFIILNLNKVEYIPCSLIKYDNNSIVRKILFTFAQWKK
jgi:hypothetical protein